MPVLSETVRPYHIETRQRLFGFLNDDNIIIPETDSETRALHHLYEHDVVLKPHLIPPDMEKRVTYASGTFHGSKEDLLALVEIIHTHIYLYKK